MPRVITPALKTASLSRRYIPLYACALLLMFHTYVVAYINSSFLEQFISTQAIGTMYIVGSALTVAIFLLISHALKRFGNRTLTLWLLAIDAAAVIGLSLCHTVHTVIPLLLIHLTMVPLIVFTLDVFLEERMGNDEGHTGSRRGLLLTLMSMVGALSPFISSELVAVAGGSFSYAYIASAAALFPIAALLLLYTKGFRDPAYTDLKVLSALTAVWRSPDIRAVFTVHFMLQIFFMTMVVYVPLYLTNHIGLSWAEFGVIMFFAQLAYVICEYPIGIMADTYIGEKEMMALGLMILTIATAWISFVTVPEVVVWSLIMFVTRVGASFVEVTTEVHFFKQTGGLDAQVISFFRLMRPLAYLLGAVIASLALIYLPFNFLFLVVAALMIPTMFACFSIVDTK